MANDLNLVKRVVAELTSYDLEVVVFGGWAEELLGIIDSRAHKDIDLLLIDSDFTGLESYLENTSYKEIKEKRFEHKRAFLIEGVMIELFLVEHDTKGHFTKFWGKRYDWPEKISQEIDDLSVASAEMTRAYRADYEKIHQERSYAKN